MMNHSATMVPESQAARGGIPIDLAPLLTPYRQHQRLMIRVIHLPARAELTNGVKNEDASWSLAPADLDGLALLLADDTEPPPSLSIRIVVIDKNENASIVGQFEVPLPRSERHAKTKGDIERAQALEADWQRRMGRRAVAAQRLARRKTALALAQAEAEWRADSEARLSEQAKQLELDWQQKVLAERAALSEELEAALARAAAAEAAEASRTDSAEQQAEAIEVRMTAELDARIAAARSEWDKDGEARIAAAVAEAVQAAETVAEARLQEAQAEWRREAARDIEAARQQAAEAQAAAQRLEASLAEAAAQWQMESETRLANQEQVLELAWRQKLGDARSARDAAAAKAEDATRKAAALSGELEAALARLAAAETGLAEFAAEAAAVQRANEAQEDTEEADTRVAREVEARLATARSEWRKESEATLADTVEQAVRRAEALAESRLRQAREGWEREARNALAVAEGKWKAEAAKRLATAQAEWNRNSEANAAAGRRTLRRVARRQGRSQLWRRVGQACVVAGCVAAAVFLYAEFKPVLWQWAPKIIALGGDLGATALAELQSLTADLLDRL